MFFRKRHVSAYLAEHACFLAWCMAYICNSAGLILFNKYLMNTFRFPFSVPLVTMHMVFSLLALGFLFLVRPSVFAALANPAQENEFRVTFKWLLAISVLFSGQLVLTNTAYLKSSVAFLQMMKEGNVVIVYVMSLACALDTFTMRKTFIICSIVGATALTVTGEIDFSRAGFFIQASSQLLECSKLVLQSIVLSTAGRKLDPLSYNLVVSPIAAVLLLGTQGCLAIMSPGTLLRLPQWSDWLMWWPLLVVNAVAALTMNIIMACLIQRTSALTLVFCGIVKDVTVVLAGHLVMLESLSSMQAAGFTFQLTLIFIWSQVKAAEQQAVKETEQEQKTVPEALSECCIAGAEQSQYGAVDSVRPGFHPAPLRGK